MFGQTTRVGEAPSARETQRKQNKGKKKPAGNCLSGIKTSVKRWPKKKKTEKKAAEQSRSNLDRK